MRRRRPWRCAHIEPGVPIRKIRAALRKVGLSVITHPKGRTAYVLKDYTRGEQS